MSAPNLQSTSGSQLIKINKPPGTLLQPHANSMGSPTPRATLEIPQPVSTFLAPVCPWLARDSPRCLEKASLEPFSLILGRLEPFLLFYFSCMSPSTVLQCL